MKQKLPDVPRDAVPTLLLVSMALVMGALLGGLLMLIVSALPAKPSDRATLPTTEKANRAVVIRPADEGPSDWNMADRGSSAYRPVGVGDTKTLDNQLAPTTFSATEQRLLAPLQGRLNLAIAMVLGICLIGMSMAVMILRRADARLEERIRRFEHLVSRTDRDWLANLDTALEGEWEEEDQS